MCNGNSTSRQKETESPLEYGPPEWLTWKSPTAFPLMWLAMAACGAVGALCTSGCNVVAPEPPTMIEAKSDGPVHVSVSDAFDAETLGVAELRAQVNSLQALVDVLQTQLDQEKAESRRADDTLYDRTNRLEGRVQNLEDDQLSYADRLKRATEFRDKTHRMAVAFGLTTGQALIARTRDPALSSVVVDADDAGEEVEEFDPENPPPAPVVDPEFNDRNDNDKEDRLEQGPQVPAPPADITRSVLSPYSYSHFSDLYGPHPRRYSVSITSDDGKVSVTLPLTEYHGNRVLVQTHEYWLRENKKDLEP